MKEFSHNRKRIFIIISTILLCVIYYFAALWFERVSPVEKKLIVFNYFFPGLKNGELIQFFWQYAASFILLFLMPFIFIKYLFKDDIKKYGISLGNKSWNLKWLIAGLLIAPFTFFFSNDPELIREYPLSKQVAESINLIIADSFFYLFYYIGFEFIFRGYLLFGLQDKSTFDKNEMPDRKHTAAVIAISTILILAVHAGKPESEIALAGFISILWGFINLKGRSIYPVLIMHYIFGIVNNLNSIIKGGYN
jgi:membrane protease YdiL (CAAX protease family)